MVIALPEVERNLVRQHEIDGVLGQFGSNTNALEATWLKVLGTMFLSDPEGEWEAEHGDETITYSHWLEHFGVEGIQMIVEEILVERDQLTGG